jgi:hypothetical protein
MAKRGEVDMFIQGNLQRIFDALYQLGLIEPVLEMDWKVAMDDIRSNPDSLTQVVNVVNEHNGSADELACVLKAFGEKELSYLAMEVAREFADFHSREHIH